MEKIRKIFKNIISMAFAILMLSIWIINTPIVFIGYVFYLLGKFLTFQYVNEYFDRYEIGDMLMTMINFHATWVHIVHIKTLKVLKIINDNKTK